MSESRKEFEREFPIPAHWIEWSESKKRYDCHVGLADSKCSEYNIMFNVWNHQQAKIDELQKQLIAQGQNFNDQSQSVRDLEFRNVELQKQLACCREENKALLAVNNSIDRECNHISSNTVVVDHE